MEEIQSFIDVQPLPMHAQELGRINAARETGPPLDTTLNASLRARMAPLVERFAGVSGLDLASWGY